MEGTAVVLIVVSGGDIASTNQAEVVRQLANWKVIDDVEGQPAHACNDVRMWDVPRWSAVGGQPRPALAKSHR